MKTPRSLILLVVLTLLPALGVPASEITRTWRGPLKVRSQFPLDLPTLDLTPDMAPILPTGGVSLEILSVRSNTFEITPAYDARVLAFDHGVYAPDYDFNVDTETTRTTLRVDFGVARRIQLGFEMAMLSHATGFMDHTIDQLHSTIGVPTNDRDLKPEDVLNIDLLSGNDRLHITDETISAGDLTLRGKWLLYDGRSSAWSLETDVKMPTGSEDGLAGSGEFDYGGALLVSAGSARHAFHGGAGYQVLGQPKSYPIPIDNRASVFGAYEWVAGERWSLLAQLAAATSILPGGSGKKQDSARGEMIVGFMYERDVFRVGAGFIENLTTSDNTADFGLFLDLGWRLGM